ncbi:DUF2075 domain-containing protein [Myxococcota bacterium]|nr:DUF2075 domain-containing protein [Myxococcota bacterium]
MSRYLYANTLAGFLADQRDGRLLELLRTRYLELRGEAAERSELDAWRHSLPALAQVLGAEVFSEAEIFVELFMPLDNRRCDALLTGRSAERAESAVVVELKQWSALSPSHLPEHVVAGGRQELHPSIQARGYAETLRHFHSAFTDGGGKIELHACAFLHNMRRTSSHAQRLRDASEFGSAPHDHPIFFTDEQAVFEHWLSRRLCGGSGHAVARRIEKGAYLPSPRLLDHLVETVKGNHEWRLLDVQRTVYWAIRHAVQVARDTETRRVVVVHGGPGTGKSVLAIQLLADAARQHWVVAHATGSMAFQKVLQAQTLEFSAGMLKRIHNARKKKDLPVDELFTTFAKVAKAGADGAARFDLVVCDESHRLWAHRRMKYPNGKIEWLTETSMIEELINASRVTAFFLDDNQSVRSGEIGRAERIVETAHRMGIQIETFHLDAQFRCAGSESYLQWVEHLCGHRAVNDLEWLAHDAYAVRIWSSMPALDAHLRALKAEGAKVRLVAGYCWRWSKPDGRMTLPRDLVDPRFEGWSGSWIAKTGQHLAPRQHQYYLWATNADSYDEVGSIYSAQGFEFDHVGVIWGEDLVWRDGRWIAQLDRNKDGAFKKELKNDGGDPVEKLLNVYRVLLTRGMRSTHLFILDDETRAHVQALLVPQVMRRAVGAFELDEGPERPALPPKRAPLSTGRGPRLADDDPSSRHRTAVPLIPLRAAAGGFSVEQLDLEDPNHALTWITWEGAGHLEPGMFAARVVGASMAPDIPSGSVCLFRPFDALSTHARPLLVRHAGATDPDTGGQFTVKDVVVLDVPRRRVELRSRNPDYPTIVFESADDVAALRVIAELVEVLGPL